MMRYIDENGNFIPEPDPSSGYGERKEIIIARHDAQEEILEIGHYEVIAEYPNGGKDVAWVIDTPGRPYTPAWDEYEQVILWHPTRPITADKNYAVGDLATINGTLYEFLTNVAAGCRILEGQNVVETNIEEQLTKLKGEI